MTEEEDGVLMSIFSLYGSGFKCNLEKSNSNLGFLISLNGLSDQQLS